ncbi:MAG: thiamine phosphate synthase [Candidatus Acidiferrales bacterium]
MFPPLYAIMNSRSLRTSELTFAGILAEAGVELIQYRNKEISSRRLLEISTALVSHLHPRGVRFIVNDRPDVCTLSRAQGVHLGQEDLGVQDARAILDESCWVGISTHSLDQVRDANATSADYIAVGPIFPTRTKENSGPEVGLEFIAQARALTRKPLVAIGGITLATAADVYGAGADSVAVASDLCNAANPGDQAKAYFHIAEKNLPRAGTA